MTHMYDAHVTYIQLTYDTRESRVTRARRFQEAFGELMGDVILSLLV